MELGNTGLRQNRQSIILFIPKFSKYLNNTCILPQRIDRASNKDLANDNSFAIKQATANKTLP